MKVRVWFTVGVALSLLAGCTNVLPEATPTAVAATFTAVPTATTTVTPIRPRMSPVPAVLPTPTNDPREPTAPPGTLRTANWPVGTAAIATFGTNSATVDIAAVVRTVPVPLGADLAFYVAVPPRREYAAFVTFPASQEVMMLQPGDTIRLIGRAAGTVPLPPLEGSGVIVNVIGQRFVRGNTPLPR